MEKPRINLTYDASTGKDDSRERIPSLLPRAFRRRKGADGGEGRGLLLPFLLATITGVLLGVCLLVLFKGQQNEATVSVIPPPATGQTAEVKGAAQAGGFALYAWQLGSVDTRAKAEELQKQIAAKGVQGTIRGEGPFQLFAAVAPNKQAGLPVETELKKLGIAYYAKEFKLVDSAGSIAGLQEADAQNAGQALGKAVKLADRAVQATLAGAGGREMTDELSALQAEWKSVSDRLAQAGQKEQAAQWDGLYKQLGSAVEAAAGGQGLLAAESKLVAFYISYESLTSQLIR